MSIMDSESGLEAEKKSSFMRLLTFRKCIIFSVKILIAVAIIYWLAAKCGNTFFAALKAFNMLYFIPVVLLMLFSLLVNAWRWHMLLKAMQISISVYESFVLCMKSMFISLAIPGGGLSADLIRLTFIVRRAGEGQKMTGAMTVFMDRFTGMLALFILTLCLFVFEFSFFMSLRGLIASITWGIVILCIMGLSGGFLLWNHKVFERVPLISSILLMLDKYGHGVYSRLSNSLDAYHDHRKTVLLCIVSGIFFMHVPNGLAVYFIAVGMNMDGASLLSSLSSISFANIAGLLPFTPSGIGARDFVNYALLDRTGSQNGAALAVAVIFTGIMILLNCIGAVFFVGDSLISEKK